MNVSTRVFHSITNAALIALIALCLAWELWLAPLRPGGSWLALKVLPLLLALPGIVRGRIRAYQAITLLIIAYFIEGVVRAWSDKGLSAQLALIEIALAVIIFASAIAYVRSNASKSTQTKN